MARHACTKLKPRTVGSCHALLHSHIRPAIGTMRVTEIRRADVSKLHHSLAGTPGAANRTIAAVSAVWNWTAAERAHYLVFSVKARDGVACRSQSSVRHSNRSRSRSTNCTRAVYQHPQRPHGLRGANTTESDGGRGRLFSQKRDFGLLTTLRPGTTSAASSLMTERFPN